MKVTRQINIEPNMFQFDYSEPILRVRYKEENEREFLTSEWQQLEIDETCRRLLESLKFWIERNLK